MTIHEEVSQTLRKLILNLDASGDVDIEPEQIADSCYRLFAKDSDDVHVIYGAIEHYKSMARKILADRYDPDSEDNPVYGKGEQGELFSGYLQPRYPVRHKRGETPVYRLLAFMSREDLVWNSIMLRKSGAARIKHADAIDAYVDGLPGAHAA